MYFEEWYGGVNYTRTSVFFITIKRRITYRAHILRLRGYDPVLQYNEPPYKVVLGITKDIFPLGVVKKIHNKTKLRYYSEMHILPIPQPFVLSWFPCIWKRVFYDCSLLLGSFFKIKMMTMIKTMILQIMKMIKLMILRS